MRSRKIWAVILVAILSMFSGCSYLAISRKFKSGRLEFWVQADTIHFEKKHPIIVDVRINDSEKSYPFIFDLGAVTMIDSKIADKLGIEKHVKLPSRGGMGEAFIAKDRISLIIGRTKIKDFIPIIYNISDNLTEIPDIKITGVIGSDILRFFKVTIDYEKKTLILSKPESKDSFQDTAEPIKLKLKMSPPLYFPVVECTINDSINAEGVLDTGSPFSIVCPISLIKEQKFPDG